MDLVADENVPKALIDRLRADGHKVDAISDFGQGAADSRVLELANVRSVVLMTHDRDFGKLAVVHDLAIMGVILLETERLPLPRQVERVSACLSDATTTWVGNLSVIEPTRIRQRAL